MLDLHQTASLVGHYSWFERRLFEITGSWVTTVTDPGDVEAKLLLAEQSAHHAWHAEMWHQRLPQLREMDPASVTISPSDAFTAFVDELAATTGTVERLAGLGRVAVPRLLVAMDAHAAVASTLADASVLRTIGIVRDDLLEDWLACERVLRGLVVDAGVLQRAVGAQARLDALPGSRIPLG